MTRWILATIIIGVSPMVLGNNPTIDSASGVVGNLVQQAQSASGSVTEALGNLGVSVSAVGDHLSDPNAVRGVVGWQHASFSFQIPPACQTGHPSETLGLGGVPIVTYCREPSGGLISMMVCLQVLQHKACGTQDYQALQLPTNGQTITQHAIQWQGLCDAKGQCQGAMQYASHTTSNTDTLDVQANSVAHQSGAYQTIQKAYNVKTISYLNSFTAKGSAADVQTCMDGAENVLVDGVYRSCNGQNEDSFSKGCHLVKTCNAYADKTTKEHYQQVCTIQAATQTVHCTDQPHVDVINDPYEQDDPFSGHLSMSNANTFTFVIPESGSLKKVWFNVGSYGKKGPYACKRLYSGYLDGRYIGGFGPVGCGKWMGSITIINSNLDIPVTKGEVMTFFYNQIAKASRINYENYSLTIHATHIKKVPVVSWEEQCDH